jgi:hypothetical protein
VVKPIFDSVKPIFHIVEADFYAAQPIFDTDKAVLISGQFLSRSNGSGTPAALNA